MILLDTLLRHTSLNRSKVFDNKLKKLAKFELKKFKKMLTSAETSDKIRKSLEGDAKTTKGGNGL